MARVNWGGKQPPATRRAVRSLCWRCRMSRLPPLSRSIKARWPTGVVLDIANPLDWSSMDRVVTPEGSSSAEETAKRVPDSAAVVKAFNTTFAQTLVTGEAAGESLQVLIAGD